MKISKLVLGVLTWRPPTGPLPQPRLPRVAIFTMEALLALMRLLIVVEALIIAFMISILEVHWSEWSVLFWGLIVLCIAAIIFETVGTLLITIFKKHYARKLLPVA